MHRLLIIPVALILAIALAGAAYASSAPHWTTLNNIKGQGDRMLYGYFMGGNVFIECEQGTDKPTGKAYLGTGKTEPRLEDVIVDYSLQEGEDTSEIRRIDPLEITLMAPNAHGKISYTVGEDGEVIKSATTAGKWPSGRGMYLIPDSDPDYWLIVARVKNPNNWPVTAVISVYINDWQISSSKTKMIEKDTTVTLGPNETKYVLVNRGHEGTAISYRHYDYTVAGYYAQVKENHDPELPDYLKANRGYLDGGYDMDGNFFSIPLDNYSGKLAEGLGVSIWPGPGNNNWENMGPGFIDHKSKEVFSLYNEKPRTFSIKDPQQYKDGGGWISMIPVLQYKNIMIEMYRFEPLEAPDIGKLVKEVSPGYQVRAASISRPYFMANTSLKNYQVENTTGGVLATYEVDAVITATNPSNVTCTFANLNLYLSGDDSVLSTMQLLLLSAASNIARWETPSAQSYNTIFNFPSPIKIYAGQNPKNVSIGTVTLGPGETKTIFSNSYTVAYSIPKKFSYSYTIKTGTYTRTSTFRDTDINNAASFAQAACYWNGEPFILKGGPTLTVDAPNILSFNSAIGRYKNSKGSTQERIFGLASGNWLDPLDYFNGEGIYLRASDELWAKLRSGPLTVRLDQVEGLSPWGVKKRES